jgi:hypothetical protein
MTITPAQVQEIRELLAKASKASARSGTYFPALVALHRGVDQLLPDLLDSYDKMREALEFYGDKAWSIGDGVVPPTQELLDDCGQRARSALHHNDGERSGT